MLDREKVIVALERKRSQFEEHANVLIRQQGLVQSRLQALQARSSREILDYLNQAGIEWPGALPTDEFDQADNLCILFDAKWVNHQDARAWAMGVLQGKPVVAVDGSQIVPTKDLNIPVGAVQVGWYINYHVPGGHYVKDVEFEVLGPAELGDELEEDMGDTLTPSWRVSQARFLREADRLCAIIEEFADTPDDAKPLCFFDGSFIVSFAGQLRPERARPYIQAVTKLLDCSARWRVPLVAYVDRSYSRDFVNLVDVIATAHTPVGPSHASFESLRLSDAALFAPLLADWGDRTPLFYCARGDSLSMDDRAPFYTDVAFTYMRLTRDGVPARVEMPRWLVEEGRADEILDRVRGECVVGTGYPYAVETADALAVISGPDRERFYGIFEQFAQQAGMALVQTRKAASKVARR